MWALASSSALAVNFFDAWREAPKDPLASALGFEEDIAALSFEHKCKNYPVGPKSPNLDVSLTLKSGARVGIESKFAEPFRTPGVDSVLALKYYPVGSGRWRKVGLEGAQRLADKMRGQWDYLDVPQLLKHLLGLRSEAPHEVARLLYLWFDTGLEDAQQHRKEVEQFRDAIDGDGVDFKAITYQELFRRLDKSHSDPAPGWRAYLGERYFSQL